MCTDKSLFLSLTPKPYLYSFTPQKSIFLVFSRHTFLLHPVGLSGKQLSWLSDSLSPSPLQRPRTVVTHLQVTNSSLRSAKSSRVTVASLLSCNAMLLVCPSHLTFTRIMRIGTLWYEAHSVHPWVLHSSLCERSRGSPEVSQSSREWAHVATHSQSYCPHHDLRSHRNIIWL